jgi:hypothetical protein
VKASELQVGTVVAVTDGASKYERKTRLATQCKVTREPRSGYVEVELLEDAKSGLGNRRTWSQEGLAKQGERVRIKTVCAWMPWDRLSVRAKNEKAAEEQKDREEKARADRLAELQRRTDQFAGEVDESISWSDTRFHPYSQGDQYVRLPTAALEALLDRAEGKR